MPYQEIDDQGNPTVNDAGENNIIDDPGSWDLIRDQIPEDLQGEKFWEQIPDTATLLKNYAHAQKFQGQAVKIPGEDATEDDWSNFFTKMGRPESHDGYEVTLPEVKGGWNDDLVDGFKKTAHQLGLTPGQVQGVLNFYGPAVDGMIEAADRNFEQEMQAATDQLKEKYGAAYDQKIAVARAALQHYANDDLMERLENNGMLNDARFIEMFAGIGEILQEDGLITGHVDGVMTKEAAKEELAKLQEDPKGPYWDQEHPGHKEAVAKAQRLFQIIYPEPVKQ